MLPSPLAVVSAPLDCSGQGRGEEAGSSALLDAGFGDLSDRRVEALDIRIRDRRRDPESGILAQEQIALASRAISSAVAAALEGETSPVVLGGDCTVLIGALSGARAAGHRPPLLFLDGHPDALPPHRSLTGETADMDFGVVTGTIANDLTGDATPLVAPGDALMVGFQPGDLEGGGREVDFVDPAVRRWPAARVHELGAESVGLEVARILRGGPAVWLHLDVDVFDPAVLPAVTYPEPGGLTYDQVTALLQPVVEQVPLLGVTVADFVADADPSGDHARRLTNWFSDVLAP